MDEKIHESLLDDQNAVQQVETVNEDDDEEVEEPQQQRHRRSERTRSEPVALSCNDEGQQIDTKAQQCCQTVNKIRVERKHNLFQTPEQIEEHSTTEAMVLGRCMGDVVRRHSEELVFSQQCVLEKRLLKFGKQGKQATVKEVRQTHDQKCFEPTLVNELSAIERKKAQNATMHLTKKRDKSIKGRMACNGAPTREWLG